jgi:hypothetical protein
MTRECVQRGHTLCVAELARNTLCHLQVHICKADYMSGGNARTWVEEHVSYGRGLLMHLEWMTREHDTFREDPRCVRVQEGPHGN